MLHSMLQIEIDSTNIDCKTSRDLPMRQMIQMRCNEHVALPRRQLVDGFLEVLHLHPGFGDRAGIGILIGKLDDGIDLDCAQKVPVASAAIRCRVEGHAKEIVQRTVHFDGIRDPLDPQESLMQRLAGELCRSHATCQAPNQAFVLGRQDFPQRFPIRIAHQRHPISLPVGERSA